MKKTLFFLLVLFFVLACVVQPFSVPDFPYDPMLQSADLPAGFERVNGEFPHVSGGFSHLVAYSDEPGVVGIGISHQLTFTLILIQQKAVSPTGIRNGYQFLDGISYLLRWIILTSMN
jgi:hypothetical protein